MSSSTSVLPDYMDCFGLIEGAAKGKRISFLKMGFPWVIDNGIYTGVFKKEKWIKSLDLLLPFRDTCLEVALPDELYDCRATVEKYFVYLPHVRERGYPAALVTQDGMRPEDVPWDHVDGLFIGGTNEHKLGPEGAALIEAGKEKGVWVHVGRVNSRKRLLHTWQADSWDGTAISIEPDTKSRILGNAVREVRRMKGKHPNGLLIPTLRHLALESVLDFVETDKYPILNCIPDLDCMVDQGTLDAGMILHIYDNYVYGG